MGGVLVRNLLRRSPGKFFLGRVAVTLRGVFVGYEESCHTTDGPPGPSAATMDGPPGPCTATTLGPGGPSTALSITTLGPPLPWTHMQKFPDT